MPATERPEVRKVQPSGTVSIVYVTCGSTGEARDIAYSVVTENLAACGNIIDGMRSIYCWKGEVQEEDEVLLILKTRRDLVDILSARVRQLHSFEVPCVVEIPIQSGNPDYFDWILLETARGKACE